MARAYRDTGIPVKLPVYGTGRIPVQERHCGTSEMLVPVDIDLENNTVPVPIPVPIERILWSGRCWAARRTPVPWFCPWFRAAADGPDGQVPFRSPLPSLKFLGQRVSGQLPQ